jgi:hypothetical protein
MVFYHKIILLVIYFIFYAKIFEKSLYTTIIIVNEENYGNRIKYIRYLLKN